MMEGSGWIAFSERDTKTESRSDQIRAASRLGNLPSRSENAIHPDRLCNDIDLIAVDLS